MHMISGAEAMRIVKREMVLQCLQWERRIWFITGN